MILSKVIGNAVRNSLRDFFDTLGTIHHLFLIGIRDEGDLHENCGHIRMFHNVEIARLCPSVNRPDGVDERRAHAVGKALGLLCALRVVIRGRPLHLAVRERIRMNREEDVRLCPVCNIAACL